jgi:hypothetical protein
VDYLAGEVPRWARENHCHSCHNNGDAARALFLAARRGYSVPGDALADTVRWLERPMGWDDNGGKGFSDKKLARVQFAGALTEAYAAGFVRDRRALLLPQTRPPIALAAALNACENRAPNAFAIREPERIPHCSA